MARRHPEAVRITTATQGRSADIGARQRRYVISMAIRTLCFVLAIVFMGVPVLMWTFIIASFVLPYVAVVMANAGAATDPSGPAPYDPDRKAIEQGPPDRRRSD